MPGSSFDYHSEFQQALLLAISENIFDFVAVVREDDRKIVYVNEMGVRLFEYESASELLGKFGPSLRGKPPGPEHLKMMVDELAAKGYYIEETEYKTKNNRYFWGRLQLNPFSAGGVRYLLVQIEKIDRAKEAEEKLLKEKQRFGALLDYASIGVVIVNEQQEIVLMNPFGLHLFGYNIEEVAGKKIECLIPSRYHKKHRNHLRNYYANPQNRPMGQGMDLFAVKKDGTEFPMEISLGTYKTKTETFVIAFLSDITIRKKNEEKIKNLNAVLEASVKERTDQLSVTISKLERQIKETEEAEAEIKEVETFQKAILDNAGAIIIATDPAGLITLFNPAAEKILGYTATEVIGKYTPTLFHDAGETAERAKQFTAELKIPVPAGFETYVVKSRFNMLNENEWIYIKKDGTKFPVSLTVTALHNENNIITGFLGVAVDISELKKKEWQLEKALEKEKDLGVLKSRFVSTASHEFRTPLSTILSSAYLLEKYAASADQPKREKHIERIVSSVNMLTDILNDFLSVGKIEEGKIAPKFSRFNIRKHIEGVVNEMMILQEKGPNINYHHSGGEEVWLDPSLLKHIVMNLLSNAIKFSPEESIITVETEKKKDSLLRLRVRDQGIGISEEDQKHLFERFFRGANVTTIQGTGLGLHIMKKYAEMMDGKAECRSKLGKGTEFVISFELKNQ